MSREKQKVLFLVSRRNFENARGQRREISKHDELLSTLECDPDVDLRVDFHVESLKFLSWSSHGWHLSVRISLVLFVFWRLPRVFSTFTKVRRVRQDLLAFLKSIWANVAKEFWEYYLARKDIQILMGVMLNEPEILAARHLGIRTCEVQHGILSDKTLENYFPRAMPDAFASWPLNHGGQHIPVGMQAIPVPFTWKRDFSRNSNPEDTKALIILGHEVGDSADPAGFLTRSLETEVLECLSQELQLVMRFHPKANASQRELFFEWFTHTGLTASYQSFRDRSISEAIDNARLVVMDRSTSWLDSIARERPCVIANVATHEEAINFFPSLSNVTIFRSVSSYFRSVPLKRSSVGELPFLAFQSNDYSHLRNWILRLANPSNS